MTGVRHDYSPLSKALGSATVTYHAVDPFERVTASHLLHVAVTRLP